MNMSFRSTCSWPTAAYVWNKFENIAAIALIMLFAFSAASAQSTVYNSIPNVLAPNYPSQPFQAQQTSEFGDFVHLAGSDRRLGTVRITMSNWALQSTPANVAYCNANPGSCTSQGFYHPFTVSIYNIGGGAAGTRSKGSTIATVTQTKLVPWRPVADPTCPGGTPWRASDGNCYNGLAFNLTFDMSSLGVTLPNDVIVGIAYNTQSYGTTPLGVDGPYNSLNVSAVGNLTAGTDDNSDNVFWNTSHAPWYSDGGAAGFGVFREDSNWTPFGTVPIQINTVGSTLLVRPSSQLDWAASTATGGTVGFSADATAPSGDGALHLTTINDNSSRAQYSRPVNNVPLSSVFQASYWSKTNSGSAFAAPSYSLAVYLDGTPATFTNFVHEPYWSNGTADSSEIIPGTWQQWDVFSNPNLWSSRTVNAGGSCVTTAGGGGPPFYSLGAIKAACPNAVVVGHAVYMGSFNPAWDTYVDLVNFNGTQWDLEPDPSVVAVDDDGMASAADCDAADVASSTIQAGINAAVTGEIVKVCPGNYIEDVNINKANLILQGAGAGVSNIIGPLASGGANTVTVTAFGVTVDGFTITRQGNTASTWTTAQGQTHNQGINVAASSNFTLQNSEVTGNRNGIYIGQSSHNALIRRNTIDFNRTGVHLVDNNGAVIRENFIRDNWTMGILYRCEGCGVNPSPMTVIGNNISGNWYSEVEFREPAIGGLLNMSGNYLGTTSPTLVTTTSGEPGYNGQIPVAYGGSSTAPATHPTIAGPQSARVDFSPVLNSGVDIDLITPGFQGSTADVTVAATSPQANGILGNIQEGISFAQSGGSVTALAGSYAGNVTVNKAITFRGTPAIGGSLTVSSGGASIVPGFSPGIISSGDLSLVPASNVNIEINGLAPGSGHDQLDVSGTVNLGGASLNVTTSFGIAPGNSFVIVSNDGAEAVTGIFAGRPEGSTFVVAGTTFAISYAGGDGNDVVLTASAVTCNSVSIPTAISTLTGVQVEVPINTDDLTGRGAFGYETSINYDPSVISYIGIEQVGTLSSGLSIIPNAAVPGTLGITAFSTGPNPLAGAGVLLKVRFQVIGPISPTPSPVTFNGFMFNEDAPCSTETNGSVQIISGTLSGTVTYVNGTPTTPGVPNVNVAAVGTGGNVGTTTDSFGDYSLSGFGAGSYTVTPSKAALPSGSTNTAISNVDSTRIAQHTVGLVTLNANQIIAGDVTGNGTVSNLDATYISQWKVGIPNPGTTGTWIFQPVSRSYPNMNASITGEDYNAILKGDVTGNWDPTEAPFLFDRSEEPTKDTIIVTAAEGKGNSGSMVTVPVRASDLSSRGVTGFEFEIEFDPDVLQPADIAADLSGTISEGMTVVSNSPEPGRLLVVVYGVNALRGEGTLINMHFAAIGPVGSESKITFRNLVLNENEIRSYPVSGIVRIVESENDSIIRGTVTTGTGEGIEGVTVTAADTNGNAVSVRTGQAGRFEFGGLATGGTYTISVIAKGLTFRPIDVSTGDQVIELLLMPQ